MSLQECFKAIRLPKAEWYGIREVSESTTFRYARDGKPQENESDSSHGLMIEVLADGTFGYAATADRSPTAVRDAADKAFARAQAAAPYSVHRFSADARPPSTGTYQSPVQQPLHTENPGEVNDFLIRACEKLKVSDKIVCATAMVRFVDCDIRFLSSNGADIEQSFNLISSSFAATAQDGALIQSRSLGGFRSLCVQAGLEAMQGPQTMENILRVGEEAVELLSADPCPEMTTDLVLTPDQMILQIHESIGHPLEIDRILGDERNYAGSSFVKAEDFGNLQYGSKHLNITFDPTVAGEFASYGFDDNGVTAKREFLIQNGKLLRGLGGIESQMRSGLPGVANARSSQWNRAPIDRMGNINLEPGTASYNEIIESVEDGVLMMANNSWSIDDYRRKFQFGCEYGKRIRNGKLAETVRNPNYRGISVPFWNNLKQVGNAASIELCGTPYCGKGEPNQVIRVGHATPVCLFGQVEVFGGA